MQITLDFPPNLEIQLLTSAEQQKLSLNDYIIECLLQNYDVKIPNHST